MLRRLAGRCLMGAGALMLALAAVTSAFAQGMFYAEETKDGRIYVFNNARRTGSASRRPARRAPA